MEDKFTVGLVVANKVGVLNRVAGLFAKRCYNIDSITVGETENPRYSRMTIVSRGDQYIQEQVVKQLWKLFDVKKVALLSADDTVSREHLLVKMSVNNQTKATATEIINTYGGKIMDFWDDCVTVEITDNSDMIDQFIKQAEEIGILELCRSGCIAMLQGKANILNVKDLN